MFSSVLEPSIALSLCFPILWGPRTLSPYACAEKSLGGSTGRVWNCGMRVAHLSLLAIYFPSFLSTSFLFYISFFLILALTCKVQHGQGHPAEAGGPPYLSSFAHSARPGHKVEVLGWIRKGLNYQDVGSDVKNSMVLKRVVAFTVVMGQVFLIQPLTIFGDHVGG